MFLSGFLRCINTDQTDCCLKTVLSDRDRVAIGDPSAFVLGGMNDDRKDEDDDDEGRVALRALVAIRMPSTPYYK